MLTTMATVNFSVLDEVKAEFDKIFGDQNRSSIIADLMRRAVLLADPGPRTRYRESTFPRRVGRTWQIGGLAASALVGRSGGGGSRLAPQTAASDVEMLSALEFPTTHDPNVIRRATGLAIETNHHLFDALITPSHLSTKTHCW